jgi:hypothetical protein
MGNDVLILGHVAPPGGLRPNYTSAPSGIRPPLLRVARRSVGAIRAHQAGSVYSPTRLPIYAASESET